MTTLRDLRMITRIFGWRSPDRPVAKLKRTCDEHTDIIAAISDQNAVAARELMAVHIRRGCEGALQAYDARRMADTDEPPFALQEALGEMESQK